MKYPIIPTHICAIRFPHTNLSTFHIIVNICYHSNRIQELCFTAVAIQMNKESSHFL